VHWLALACIDVLWHAKYFFLTGCGNRCPIHHFKLIEAMKSKGIHVRLEIKSMEDRISSVAGLHHFYEYEFAFSMVN
jgi:hypothetical protein